MPPAVEPWPTDGTKRNPPEDGPGEGSPGEASPRGGVQAGVLVGRTGHPKAKPALDSWPGGRHGESQRPLFSSWEEVGGENREAGRGADDGRGQATGLLWEGWSSPRGLARIRARAWLVPSRTHHRGSCLPAPAQTQGAPPS